MLLRPWTQPTCHRNAPSESNQQKFSHAPNRKSTVPNTQLIGGMVHSYHYLSLASVQNSAVRNRIVSVACLSAICISLAVAVSSESNREQQREQARQDLAFETLHNTDLHALYAEINHASFADQLPPDVPVSWADLRSNPYCGKCGAATDYDLGSPRIRFDTERVRSENFLRFLMRHEMCHVASHNEATRLAQDPHGPIWQECMKRFD